MKYKVSFKLVNQETNESKQVRAEVDIVKSDCFDYGNGKCMSFKYTEGIAVGESEVFDIRYDKSYDSEDEASYIKGCIKNRWSGKYGSWKAQYITVKKIFKLECED